jgi:hypothetical protein
MAPVASANPNDAGVVRRRGGKRRWRDGNSRGPGGPPGGGSFQRADRPADGRPQGGPGAAPWAQSGEGNGAPGERRRRRRRRRRRGNGLGIEAGNGAPQAGPPPNGNEPVVFFQPASGAQQPAVLGPDGQPIRKRRRRRRRGRGGRNRDWRMQQGGGGAPPSEGGGGGTPPGDAG